MPVDNLKHGTELLEIGVLSVISFIVRFVNSAYDIHLLYIFLYTIDKWQCHYSS
jgi:hypothetical protein